MPKQRYSSYKPTNIDWIWEIPENWEIRRMKNIFNRHKNIVWDKSSEYKVLALTLKWVIERDLENNFWKFPETFDGYQIVRPDTLIACLFDIDVTPRIIGYVNKTGIMTSAYTNFDTDKKDIYMKYYYYYILRMNIEDILLHFSKSLRSTIVYGDFLCIEWIIPTLTEQQTIATYLDDKTSLIDKAITLKEKQIQLLKEKRTALINHVVTKGLDPDVEMVDSGIEWIGSIPKGWEVRKLRWIFDDIWSWWTPASTNKKYHENWTINWLNTGELNDWYIYEVKKKITNKALKEVTSLKIFPDVIRTDS